MSIGDLQPHMKRHNVTEALSAGAHSISDIQEALLLELIDADGCEEPAPQTLTQMSTSDIVNLPYAWGIRVKVRHYTHFVLEPIGNIW